VLLDAISHVTETSNKFKGLPQRRAAGRRRGARRTRGQRGPVRRENRAARRRDRQARAAVAHAEQAFTAQKAKVGQLEAQYVAMLPK
jgi:hypothetical protein